jgi:NTP pyrophosphatase (non-canonical NTP hydrolase)
MIDYTLNDYQLDALTNAKYPHSGEMGGLTYTVLALCGESGELANKLKKVLRDGKPLDRAELMDELSDVLWYVSAVAMELSYDLETVANFNIEKLRKRAEPQKSLPFESQ